MVGSCDEVKHLSSCLLVLHSAPPNRGLVRWGCENCPFSLLFGDVLWKVRVQERYVRSLVKEKKASMTMKEGLDEVVESDLCDNGLCYLLK